MTARTPDVIATVDRSGRDRVVDAVRQVAHVAHEARLLTTLAADTVEDGLHAAKRTLTRTKHNLEDLRDTATSGMRRDPLRTAAIVFGAGVLVGAAIMWMKGKRRRVVRVVDEGDNRPKRAMSPEALDPLAFTGEVRR
jgi:hypothetical protein